MKINVNKMIENPDGTATLDFEIDEEMEEFVAKSLGVTVEELTQEQLQNFITTALLEAVKKSEQENKQD